jgi:hypothetical protein
MDFSFRVIDAISGSASAKAEIGVMIRWDKVDKSADLTRIQILLP